jgi:hypothetical protein
MPGGPNQPARHCRFESFFNLKMREPHVKWSLITQFTRIFIDQVVLHVGRHLTSENGHADTLQQPIGRGGAGTSQRYAENCPASVLAPAEAGRCVPGAQLPHGRSSLGIHGVGK